LVTIEELTASKARLTIASLLSIRPRTLGELAETTGISVQGVLKHLVILRRHGLLREIRLKRNEYLRVKKLYSIDNRKIGDYSEDDLMIAHMVRSIGEIEADSSSIYLELENLAEEILFLQRKVRDYAKKMGRIITELASIRLRLASIIDSIELREEEKQIAKVLFTEDSLNEAKNMLSKHYGCKDAGEAIDKTVMGIKSYKNI
jgi:predicted ArsR family transcriptional regulator